MNIYEQTYSPTNLNSLIVKKENKLSGFLKWKLFVLSKYPKIYILLKKLTKRY